MYQRQRERHGSSPRRSGSGHAGGPRSRYEHSSHRGRPRYARNSSYGRQSHTSDERRGQAHPRGGGRTERINVSMFINKAVVVEETERHFVPEHAFADFPILPSLKRAVAAKGYTSPTPIQDRAIPHILHGKDVVGIANTGTGKTAAFLVPLINKVLTHTTERVLIVVPTRELALQINEELRGFTPKMNVASICCVGGAHIVPQIRGLRHHNHFVIGTPGRLKDLIERKALDLSATRTVVLDEADRMLDMGFIGDMRYLMGQMPRERHTLFFSATLSKDIEKLIHEFLREPVSISVKTRDTAQNIDQDIIRVERGKDKLDVLHDLLIKQEFTRVLVFGRTKHGVQKLAAHLFRRGFKAEAIHGNKSHSQRQKALRSFKEGAVQVLVATDVAARGLDIPSVSHVINYDMPATYDDYVHRIGRTGRASATGKALTFVE